MQLTEFETDDLAPAAELFAAIFSGEPWNEEWTAAKAEKRLKDFMSAVNFFGVCCYEQEELLGFALGHREQWPGGEGFHLQEMGVKKARQGQGIGTKLLKELGQQLKQEQVGEIYLVTAQGSRAESFYRANGFTVNQELVVMDKKI